MNSNIRTDLALEAREIWAENSKKSDELRGVETKTAEKGNIKVTTVEILDRQGERALDKPMGKYVSVELEGFLRREENSFDDACALISEELKNVLNLKDDESVLVAGLGNSGITPDSIGPECVSNVMVTRHLKTRMPNDFKSFRSVSAVCTGVLGTTGMESKALLEAVTAHVKPSVIIAVDALASRRTERLCSTIQIADTGIVPGSGVGNAREALNKKTLGIPVIAIGVPTVVDAGTLAISVAKDAGISLDPSSLGAEAGMIVTTRDIDKQVKDISRIIGYSINMALHDGLRIEDVTSFIS